MVINERQNTVLVSIMNNQKDWAILNHEGWYRIPTTTNLPILRSGKAAFIAFYHTGVFEEAMRWKILHFGKIKRISEASRHDLFPEEPSNSLKSGKSYHKIEIEKLETLPQPICSRQGRRLVFITTTHDKFFSGTTDINTIFNTSSLEEKLLRQMASYKIPFERQWFVQVNEQQKYWLDFAVFCQDCKINIECDGDAYHNTPEQVHYDKTRNDELVSHNWHVLRYTEKHMVEEPKWVETNILRTIKLCKGYQSSMDESVYVVPKAGSVQMRLFE